MIKKICLLTGIILVGTLNCSEERPKSPDQRLSSVMGSRSDEAVVEYLKRHHVNVNGYDAYAQSPLYLAVFYRLVKTTDWLLKHGARPSYTDRYGTRPLVFAQQSKESNSMIYTSDGFIGIKD